MFMILMLSGAAVGGFALSQWLMENERAMQNAYQQEMQARIATLTKSESQLADSRNGARAEIEAGVMKRLGLEGVVVVATVAPCKAPVVVNTPTLASRTDDTCPDRDHDPAGLPGRRRVELHRNRRQPRSRSARRCRWAPR